MTVKKALNNNSWITHIDLDHGFQVEHIQQFVILWELVSNTHLSEGIKDTISWKIIKDGLYSVAPAYKMQFEGTILIPMEPTIL
jgi:hypothetical protein